MFFIGLKNRRYCGICLPPLINFRLFQVKWAKENYHHNIGSPYSLRLASADVTGKIIVWDVATGTARCEIQEHAKPIQGNGGACCLCGRCFMEHRYEPDPSVLPALLPSAVGCCWWD